VYRVLNIWRQRHGLSVDRDVAGRNPTFKQDFYGNKNTLYSISRVDQQKQNRMKEIVYIGSAQKDLKKMPNRVKGIFTHALQMARRRLSHPDTKALKGFCGRSVIEVIVDHHGDTYRAMYTVKFKGVLYLLHVFKKKSKKGIATPKKDIELLKQRLKRAEAHYKSIKNTLRS